MKIQVHALLQRAAWRIGRKLYCWGRGEVENDPARNGEYWLLRHFLLAAADSAPLLDVGANVGSWSLQALACATEAKKSIRLHAFEPCAGTRGILERKLSSYPGVEICAFALSSAEGHADFFTNGTASGTNSLSSVSGTRSERVRVRTVDEFLRQRGIESVGMMKVDTEGFDLEVLKGADGALGRGVIELVQFEYNWRWLLNKSSLREVFTLIEGKPYRLGKLEGELIVFHDKWHFELDRFFENNYVLVRLGSTIEHLGVAARFDRSNVARRADKV